MTTKLSIVKISLLGLIFFPQITYAQRFDHEVSKEKNNNRFIASIDISERVLQVNQSYGSLVKSIKLGIEWWELMNEPVEKYMFKWERNSFVRSNKHNMHLDEQKLAKYPDLLKRYQNLKPSFISVKFNVTFSYKDPSTQTNQDIINALPKCARKKSLGLYSLEFEVTRTINSRANFFIDKAGVIGNDLVPGSPKTWKDFLPFACNANEISSDQIKNIYKSVNIAKFSGLEVVKIEYPEAEIDAIAAEYEKRENEKNKKSEDDFWNGEDKISDENSNDFWNGKDSKHNNNDFWNGKGTIEQEIELEKAKAENTGDQFIGHYSSKTKNIVIKCRDHGRIDGDRVKILINDKVIVSDLTLEGYYSHTEVSLNEGINKISFVALNNGSSGNNTAQFSIEDENKNVLYQNNWSISSGYKGTLLIIKQ